MAKITVIGRLTYQLTTLGEYGSNNIMIVDTCILCMYSVTGLIMEHATIITLATFPTMKRQFWQQRNTQIKQEFLTNTCKYVVCYVLHNL